MGVPMDRSNRVFGKPCYGERTYQFHYFLRCASCASPPRFEGDVSE
jgi:hypothetical protein